jgi:hypothetical protein
MLFVFNVKELVTINYSVPTIIALPVNDLPLSITHMTAHSIPQKTPLLITAKMMMKKMMMSPINFSMTQINMMMI